MANATGKPKRLGLILPWAAFALMALAYLGYWLFLERAAVQRFDAFLATERAAGAEASYGAVRADGFPMRLSLRFTDLVYAPADRAWRLEAPKASIHVNPTNLRHVIAAPDAPVRIVFNDGQAFTLAAGSAAASLRFSGGDLARASLDVSDFTATPDANAPGAFAIAGVLAHLRPDPRAPDAFQLALELRNWRLSAPVVALEGLGEIIESANAAVVITHRSALVGGARKDPLGPWIAAGGRANLEGLEIVWGRVQATGTGSLTLDQGRRIAGALTLSLPKPDAFFDAVARSPRATDQMRQALAAASLAARLSGDSVEAPFTAAEGILSLGPVALRPLGPVYPPPAP